MSYFPELDFSKAELDLSNYARKSDLKRASRIDTSKYAKYVHLAALKFKADVSKLETSNSFE